MIELPFTPGSLYTFVSDTYQPSVLSGSDDDREISFHLSRIDLVQ